MARSLTGWKARQKQIDQYVICVPMAGVGDGGSGHPAGLELQWRGWLEARFQARGIMARLSP